MNRYSWVTLCLLVACATPPTKPAATPNMKADLDAALVVFKRNIDAIQRKDRAAYLANYRHDERLVRAGPEGVKVGFKSFAASTATTAAAWPTRLDAFDLKVFPISPGVVYGSYRYRVTINGETTEGWSERLFVRDEDGWRIAVTTAFPK
ncbi:MAG: nuclear transport factor 2 family protein [Myxococcota bacterium]